MNLYLYILYKCISEFMDNIKNDFIHSLVDNLDDQLIDQNDKLNINNDVHNITEYDNVSFIKYNMKKKGLVLQVEIY